MRPEIGEVAFLSDPTNIGAGPLVLGCADAAEALQIADRNGHLFLYLPAAEVQANWIYHRRSPGLAVKRRMHAMRALATGHVTFLAMSRFAAHGIAEEYHVDAERVVVVPPPVDTDLFHPADRVNNSTFHILFIGGDWMRKGGEAVLPLLDDPALASCRWTFVTDQFSVNQPRATFISAIKPESVEMIQLMQSADVILLPSTADVHSLAALDAMSCGVPVIIRNIGAATEIVEDGKNGFVLDRTETEDIRHALLRYLSNRQLAVEHGKHAREHVVRENTLSVHARRIRLAIER